ncbi:hypothetical protein QOT17_017499 [Balamuthia mandrillaris]
MLKRLRVCLPPEEEAVVKFAEASTTLRKRNKASKSKKQQQGELSHQRLQLKAVSLTGDMLWNTLPSMEAYTFLVHVLACLVPTYLFQCIYAGFYPLAPPDSFFLTALSFFGLNCIYAVLRSAAKAGLRSTEFQVTVLVGLLSLVLCAITLQLPEFEAIFDFPLRKGLHSFNLQLGRLLEARGLQITIELPFQVIAAVLAGLSAALGMVSFLFGFRLGPCHHNIQRHVERPFAHLLSVLYLLISLLLVIMYVKPLCKDIITSDSVSFTVRGLTILPLTETTFQRIRLWVMALNCVMGLSLFRVHVQAFLDTAFTHALNLIGATMDEHVKASNLRIRILSVYRCICIVAVELLAPALLSLILFVLLHIAGEVSMDAGLTSSLLSSLTSFTGANTASPNFFSSTFSSAVLSFLYWWLNLFSLGWTCVSLLYVRRAQPE